jgi:heat shock protein HslJ
MVNTMNMKKNIFPFISLLVAGLFLVSVITPAAAFPVAAMTRSIDGAGCIPARSDVMSESFSDTPAAISAPWSVPGTDSGVLPEGSLNKGAAWYWGGAPEGYSDKSALIDQLAGRSSTPENPSGSASRLVSGEGTIRFIDLEGGFFGIITTTGERYIPENLPAAQKVDGNRISFEGFIRSPSMDAGKWGIPLSLISFSLPSEEISASGTVRFIELEGGFYGIITPAGDTYLPLNLPEEFQVDGLQVTFTADEEQDIATIALWGTPIRITSMARFGQQAGSLGGLWSLVTLDGEPLIPGTAITAFFDKGRISGSTGCNRYFASYTTSGSSLAVRDAGSTKMYCSSPEGIMDQEALFLTLLPEAASWSIRDRGLVIRDKPGREILTFVSPLINEPSQLIEYRRTGGFAGFDDYLVLSSDGSGTVVRKERSRCLNW